MTGLRSVWWRFKGRCPECGNDQQPFRVPECVGVVGSTNVRFRDLPMRRCRTSGHPASYVHPDFGAWLHNAFVRGDVPMSNEKFRRRMVCRRCSRDVSETANTFTFHGQLSLNEGTKVDIEITGPGALCANCGENQLFVGGDRYSDLLDACMVAFKAADIAPWPDEEPAN